MAANEARQSSVLVALCEAALKSLAEKCPGVTLACISTKDGHVIASLSNTPHGTRIAVMGGSMHALGDSIVREAALGTCNNVIIEAERGQAVLLGLACGKKELVLTGISNKETSLGLLLSACKASCELLRGRLSLL